MRDVQSITLLCTGGLSAGANRPQVPLKRKWSDENMASDLADEVAEQCQLAEPQEEQPKFWEVADPTLAMQLLEVWPKKTF